MAVGLNTGLYPPIVDSYMPAYIYGQETFRVYVNLSPYTKIEQNIYVHTQILDFRTNKSVYEKDEYMGLYLDGQIQQDKETNMYYIELPFNAFNFLQYTLYKVQFRICSRKIKSNEKIATYLNRITYSEWSTVCLIKFIKEPETTLSYFTNKIQLNDTDVLNTGIGTRFPSPTVFVSGKVNFPDNTSNTPEYVKNYQINFYQEENLIEQTALLSPIETGIDEINYVSKYNFQSNIVYKMKIHFISSGLYEWTESYSFVIDKGTDLGIIFTTTNQTDKENGRFKFNIKVNVDETNPYKDKKMILYIKRADSKTNYQYQEDVFSYELIPSEETLFGWSDMTIESGIWYKYFLEYSVDGLRRGNINISKNYTLIQQISSLDNPNALNYYEYIEDNQNYILTMDTSPVQNKNYYQISDKLINIFDNDFLVGQGGQQFKLKYDVTLNSYVYKQNISTIETIGSKFPFVRQNGEMKYRTFSIEGLISYLSDLEEGNEDDNNYNSLFNHRENEFITQTEGLDNSFLFISRNELFSGESNLEDYENYFIKNNINDYNNYIQERFFREKVIDFLINPSIKLFKTTTEGNLLVRLIDVSFNPKEGLGRYLYSFSATVIECAEATIENYNLYQIQALSNSGYSILKYNYAPTLIEDKSTHQVSGMTITVKNAEKIDIKTLIKNQYKNLQDDLENYELYKINLYSLGFSFLSDIEQNYYTIIIDKQKFFVNKEDKFKQFKSTEPMSVETITFSPSVDVNVLIDAELIYLQSSVDPSSTNDEQTIKYINSVSQIYGIKEVSVFSNGIFNYNKEIIQPLTEYHQNLYNQEEGDPFILNVYAIKIVDTAAGNLFTIKDNTETYNYIIGQSGNLNINLESNLQDDRIIIEQAYWRGTIAVWEDNKIISDTIIKISSNEQEAGLYFSNSKWVWREGYKNYTVKFYQDIQLKNEVLITSNTTLTKALFKYVHILKPIEVVGDMMFYAKLTTALNLD